MIASVNGGHRIWAHFNLDGITPAELLPMLSVKSHTGLGSGIEGDCASEHHRIGKYHWSKRKNMGADRCEDYTRDSGMD
jgi:hypothetical protein